MYSKSLEQGKDDFPSRVHQLNLHNWHQWRLAQSVLKSNKEKSYFATLATRGVKRLLTCGRELVAANAAAATAAAAGGESGGQGGECTGGRREALCSCTAHSQRSGVNQRGEGDLSVTFGGI